MATINEQDKENLFNRIATRLATVHVKDKMISFEGDSLRIRSDHWQLGITCHYDGEVKFSCTTCSSELSYAQSLLICVEEVERHNHRYDCNICTQCGCDCPTNQSTCDDCRYKVIIDSWK